MIDTYISCGQYVPEGRHVCYGCERKAAKMGNDLYRNGEGYADPTAYGALKPIVKEDAALESKVNFLIKILKFIISESGFELLNRIEVRDKKTGAVFQMNIPNTLKVGGKVYAVEITDKLNLGNVNYSGEICYKDLIIRICPSAKGKMESDFLHETVHAIWDHLGYTDHDEKKVDELANALYMIIQDNPEIFERKGEHNEHNEHNQEN